MDGSNTMLIRAISLILLVLLAGSAAGQDTTYHQNLHGIDGLGLGTYYCRSAMAADGRFAIIFLATDADSTMALVTTDHGDTWDTTTLVDNDLTVSADNAFVFARDNYIYAVTGELFDVVSAFKSESGAAFARDTVWVDPDGSIDPEARPGGFVFDTAGAMFVIEGINEATDSLFILSNEGTFPTVGEGNWTMVQKLVGDRIGDGVRAFFEWGAGLGAMIAYGGGAQNSCHYFDTSRAVHEMDNSGMLNYDVTATAYMVATKDSHGVWIEQYDTGSGLDSIIARAFYLDQTGTANCSLVFDARNMIENGTNIDDASDASPTMTYVLGTDTVIAYWKYWSGTDQGLMRCVSADLGQTWGTPEIMRTASAVNYGYLQAPQAIRIVSDTLREWLYWHPSPETDTSLQIFSRFTATAAEEAATGAQVIIVQ